MLSLVAAITISAGLPRSHEIALPDVWRTAQLVETCTNGLGWKRESCVNYMAGVYEGLIEDFRDGVRKRDVCIPSKLWFNQAADKVIRTISPSLVRNDSDPAAATVHRLLSASFPCP
jgi:hypothetical protein